MADSTEEMVLISKSRLAALEALETKHKEKLMKLRQYQIENPETHAKAVLEKYHKNKETINARRRELYKKKKESEKNHSHASE